MSYPGCVTIVNHSIFFVGPGGPVWHDRKIHSDEPHMSYQFMRENKATTLFVSISPETSLKEG